MKSPLGHVRKLSLGVCNSWYGRSILYFSQNAALEKKGPKWHRHDETSSSSVAAAETAISEHEWQIKSSKTNFLYLLDVSAAKKFACLVAADRPPNSTAYTIEMNAGLGVLTRELLEAGIPSIEMYEEVEYFWPHLTALKGRYPDRLSLKEVNFSHVMNMGYWDWREDTKKLDAYLDKVATKSHQEEPAIEIIGSLANANFVKFLIGCFTFQNSLSKYGRIRLYVAVPPSVSAQAACDNKHYGIYRTWVVMFQTLFRHEHLGVLPRFAFYPKHKKTKAVRFKCLRKIREHDDRIMHVVKIESRADVFNEEFKEKDLVTFYYFVHHHLRGRTTKIIPALEHWIPGYGRSLIADGYTIFTEFGELMPDELLRLFIKFKSSPGFLKCSFVSCMSSFFLKMEEHFVFDDTAENIDEMFQSRLEEYEEKQKTKDDDESRTAMPSEKCGYNMILDEVTSTTPFCECDRGYLYYPKFDECYPPYMRGPCDEGHYLVLRTNRRNAECIFNPCGRDNVVWYNGSCHDMYSSKGPCPGDLALVISETTFKPTCKIIKPDSYSFIVGQPRPPGECSPGTRRAAKGKGPCRPILYSSLSPGNMKLRKG